MKITLRTMEQADLKKKGKKVNTKNIKKKALVERYIFNH